MIDSIPPPSLQDIFFPDQDSFVVPTDIKPAQCFHEDNFYLVSSDSLCYFSLHDSPFQWKKIAQVPFSKRYGQSMTSTPYGIAFFGGTEKQFSTHNDLWIYNQSKDQWSYVTCDIPARSNHAAACDKEGNLVIYGGLTLNQKVLHDLYVVDLQKQTVREIVIPFLPPVSHEASLTLIQDGTFCLFGGEIALDSFNKIAGGDSMQMQFNIYKLDIEKLTFQKIQTEFRNNIESHFSAIIYDMLFVFGGYDRTVWVFNFSHNVWIPISLPVLGTEKNVKFSPFYVFTSNSFSKNKCLHMVNDDFKRLLTIPVFIDPPPKSNIQNHPNFIHFLEENLIYANRFFDTYDQGAQPLARNEKLLATRRAELLPKVGDIIAAKKAEEFFSLEDDTFKAEALVIHGEKLNKIMDYLIDQLCRETENENISSDKNENEIINKEEEDKNDDNNHINENKNEKEDEEEEEDKKEDEKEDKEEGDEESGGKLNKETNKDEKDVNDEIDVHRIVLELTNIRQKSKVELHLLEAECASLAHEIEIATFHYILSTQSGISSSSEDSNDNDNDSEKSDESSKSDKKEKKGEKIRRKQQKALITECESIEENAKQLAQAIIFEKNKLAVEMKNLNLTHLQKKDTILGIRDQLWDISLQEKEIVQKIKNAKIEFFTTLADLTLNRQTELEVADEDARVKASRMLLIPQIQKMIVLLQERRQNLLKEIKVSIDSLEDSSNKGERHRSPQKNIIRALRNLNDLQKWTEDANKLLKELSTISCTTQTISSPSNSLVQNFSVLKILQKKEESSSNQNEFFTPFVECIGNKKVFIEDIEKVLNKMEESLYSYTKV